MQEPAVNDPEWAEGSSDTEDESDGDVSSADTIPISIPPKFLLSESTSSLNDELPPVSMDPDTQARLEVLLSATGLSKFSLEAKQFNDPEVLRKLTTTVSSALDEAAAALSRMKAEQAQTGHQQQQQQHPQQPQQPQQPSQNGPAGVGPVVSLSRTVGTSSAQGVPSQPASPLQQTSSSSPQSSHSQTTAPSSPSRSLVHACMGGDTMTVKKLLDMGRDVNQITEQGESLLSLACASGYYELAQLLLVMRANIEETGMKDTTPLMEAANSGHCEIVRLLLAHGADVNAKTNQNNTALMFACCNGFEDVVQVLLEAGANPETHNESGHTPLMEAASDGKVGVARLLVKHGAQINSHSNEFKESALTLASYKGHLEMVRFLLEAGADQEHKTEEMHTALMEASMDGHVDVARLLLDFGAQVNMPQDSFESPLTLAACGGHVKLAQLLIDRGANIEEVNDEGYTPLMEAAREGHEDVVALLLSHGADVNVQTADTEETALILACCGGYLGVIDLLIKAGAHLELGGSTALMEAAQEGHLEVVRVLIGAGANVSACTETGNTALGYACENGHTDVADLLLQAGAVLEHESEGGRTPLMKAALAGNDCTVKFLLSKGADPNKKTPSNDHTALSLACAGGHTEVVRVLLDANANPSHRLKDNSSMLIEAAKGGFASTVQLLLEYRKKGTSPPPPPPPAAQASGAGAEACCQHQETNESAVSPPATAITTNAALTNAAFSTAAVADQLNRDADFRAGFECFTSMIAQSASSDEGHLRSKQHILEELHKVERELQEQVQKTCSKTNKQGFLTSLVSDVVSGTANFVAQESEAGGSGASIVAPPKALQDVDEETSNSTPCPTDLLAIDVEWQTDSNHDTALTLACTGGHKDLVALLLSKGGNIEHRDKKGFTPLMLAATAGHFAIVEILLDAGAQMEAQSERTKDTALSLACSGGRLEVVEILLNHGANREHRNVSDYTPLSLAASGGYVNIIELLLQNGAEINSRTGSKLGISPLMLAAMNGHTSAVRLLLNQGSDINAQIETNRNTALTLACFQGRHEVVSLLLDRKANVEHRAKTGLTPLMEAASGGYVDVGKVLLEKGADVNAPPVPSSRDTALTIAADKGHLRFVELLLEHSAAVDVRNKKGNSPLWLACNGGHLDVVQKLVAAKADIDSTDNRKVSCLMAAFRKGHQKVVKWMVKHVTQFPSDQEMTRYIQTLGDKELLKKCQVCMDIIHQAKERQQLEAERNADSLLKALEDEKNREEQKKAAQARRREKKRLKKKQARQANSKDDDDDDEDGNAENTYNHQPTETRPPTIDEISNAGGSPTCIVPQRRSNHANPTPPKSPSPTPVIRVVEKLPSSSPPPMTMPPPVVLSRKERKKNERNRNVEPTTTFGASSGMAATSTSNTTTTQTPSSNSAAANPGNVLALKNLRVSDPVGAAATQHQAKEEQPFEPVSVSRQRNKVSPKLQSSSQGTREEGWKEVTRRIKKVAVPASAISRVIGRGGCNINAIREVSGAYIEVEKQNPKCSQGERSVLIRGSTEATKQATNLIAGLADDVDADLLDVLHKCGLATTAAKKTVHSHLKNAGTNVKSPAVATNSAGNTASTTAAPQPPFAIPTTTKSKVILQPAPPPAQPAWSVPVSSVLKSQSPLLLPSTASTEPKIKKTSEHQTLATSSAASAPQPPAAASSTTIKSSSAPNIHQQLGVKNKAPSPSPAAVAQSGLIAPSEPSKPAQKTQANSPTPQPLTPRWPQVWSGGENKSWSVNGGKAGASQERRFPNLLNSSSVQQSLVSQAVVQTDSPAPSPRAVSSPASISPRSEEEMLTKAPVFNRASTSITSTSVHASPTNFRHHHQQHQQQPQQQHSVVTSTMSAPCTPPFGSTSGPSSPTPPMTIDFNLANNNNNNNNNSSTSNNNLGTNLVVGSASNSNGSSVSTSTVSSGNNNSINKNNNKINNLNLSASANSVAGATSVVNGHSIASLMELSEATSTVAAQLGVPPVVGATNAYKYGSHIESSHGLDVGSGLGNVVGPSMYSNNNIHPHHHQPSHISSLNNLANQMVYHPHQPSPHQDMNGAANHLQTATAAALNGPTASLGQQHHLDRQLPPLPIGTERAQQRKTSAMPSNQMWNMQGNLAPLSDPDRHWYPGGGAFDPLNAGGEYLLRSLSSGVSAHSIPNDSLLNQLTATPPGLQQPTDMYHHLSHPMSGMVSSGGLGGLLPNHNGGMAAGQGGYMFGGDPWSAQHSQAPPLHQQHAQHPPPPSNHKPSIPNYNSSKWSWLQGGQQ